jgi:hypothetical protein
MGFLQGFAAIFVFVLVADIPVSARTHNPTPCLASMQSHISSTFPVIDSKNAIFEVNTQYVVQAYCSRDQRLVALFVEERYALNRLHPEWAEPDERPRMLHTEYEKLLARVEQIQLIGPLADQCVVFYSSNGGGSCWERHEHAIVVRGVVTYPYDGTGDSVWGFSVYFFHAVSAKVEDKKIAGETVPGEKYPDHEYKLRINGQWYDTNEDTYNRLVVGRRAKFDAAGPFNWYDWD